MSELDADYAKAGFGGHLPFGKRPALLIVDVCRAYLDPASPLYAGVEDALAANVSLAAAARAAGVPVVFTRVCYSANGRDGGLFFRKVPALVAYLDDNPLGDFDDALRPLPDEIVVTKQYASAFFGTSLAASLTALGIDTLVVTGFSTSGCVRATALDALQHGFIPYVVREACGDRARAPHEANLFDLQAKYAEVVSLAEMLPLLGRDLSRPT
ncbi:isochorismatase family protein [Sphingomonas sp. UYEF23]|uniref:isochorismatase family protein n=1 Tax=Sphingomonas sp. UYEF23 TaxID=1756408 RepID=UPI003390F590